MAVFVNQELYPGEFLLHKKYAATELLLDLIWTHSNIIADVAMYLLDTYPFDKTELAREYVLQAALLCEIGVYKCSGFEWIPGQPPSQYPYIQHGVIGAWILQQEGYSPKIIQAAYCHIGVGFSVDDIRSHGLQLPEQDFYPLTPLQKIITYASKFHSKFPKFRTSAQIKESLSQFSPEKVTLFEQMEQYFGEPNIPSLEEKYAAWHNNFRYRAEQLTKAAPSTTFQASGLN